MLPQPRLHRGRLVGGGVVENHVQLLPAIAAGQPLEEGQEIGARMLRRHSPRTLPLATSRAA